MSWHVLEPINKYWLWPVSGQLCKRLRSTHSISLLLEACFDEVIRCSPFYKFSLTNNLEKKHAQDAAKQVLRTLKSTKLVLPPELSYPDIQG
jgi:hypothetical protein